MFGFGTLLPPSHYQMLRVTLFLGWFCHFWVRIGTIFVATVGVRWFWHGCIGSYVMPVGGVDGTQTRWMRLPPADLDLGASSSRSTTPRAC
jgi:hypothetical protein